MYPPPGLVAWAGECTLPSSAPSYERAPLTVRASPLAFSCWGLLSASRILRASLLHVGMWGWPSRGWPEQGAAPAACSAWTQAPRCSRQREELWLSPALCPDLRGGEVRLVLTDTDLPAGACVGAGQGQRAGCGCNSAYGTSLLGDPGDIWGA